MLDPLDEVDDVATYLTPEAVVEPLGRGDVEAGRTLLVERTQTLQTAAAGRLEGDVITDDLGNGGRSRTSATSSCRIRPAMLGV